MQMFIKKNMNKNNIMLILKKIAVLTVWLCIWQAVSTVTGLAFLLPGPVTVFLTLRNYLHTSLFYKIVFYSLKKIGSGFFMAVVLGIILGGIASAAKAVKEFLKPVVLLMKALPVAAFIIIMLIWFGSENAAVYIGFMVVFPMVYQAVNDGVSAVDKKKLEMAEIFNFSAIKKIRYIYIADILPFLNSSLQVAAGMCWKAGVSAEVIGLVKNSIGEQLYYSKLYLMMPDLFAWSITIMVMSFLFEKLSVNLCMYLGRIITKQVRWH